MHAACVTDFQVEIGSGTDAESHCIPIIARQIGSPGGLVTELELAAVLAAFAHRSFVNKPADYGLRPPRCYVISRKRQAEEVR